jgi:hypothetical protein
MEINPWDALKMEGGETQFVTESEFVTVIFQELLPLSRHNAA